ncbi:MAG: hypothetical protein JXA99_10950 [Candidatus Lokiarchaeota archaeon]|nr:hypothetical protein [Candidatus Lokiarchaeota archaeon]
MKHILISAKENDNLILRIMKVLNQTKNIKVKFYNPTEDMSIPVSLKSKIKDFDMIISKNSEKSSNELLSLAYKNNIPSINNYYSVLRCKNKIILDMILRKILYQSRSNLGNIILPKSWIYLYPLKDKLKFKTWANKILPLVFKNVELFIEANRFNFLVNSKEDLKDFISIYKNKFSSDIYAQEFIKCDGIDYKIYVVGDKIFGIKRANPIYLYLNKKSNYFDVDKIERKYFKVNNEIKNLVKIISKKINLKIYGFDLLKSINGNCYYLIDLNEFPGFKGIKNNDLIIANYIINYLNNT